MGFGKNDKPITESLLETQGHPFHPLDNLILTDEFNRDRSGWYLHHISRDDVDLDWGVVCRSTLPTHWWGSHGSQSGLYSLKIGTRPISGETTTAIKRVTMPYSRNGDWYSTMRFETFFAYHEEPRGVTSDTTERPPKEDLTGKSAVRSFVFFFDLHNRDHRWWPGIRYLNCDADGEYQGKWQYNKGTIDPLMEEYVDIPGASQELCWNSPNDTVPWKPNWHYFRIDLDMENMDYIEFQCNDQVFDMTDIPLQEKDPVHEEDSKMSAWPDIDGLLNPVMGIQTNKETRSFLFVDSLALSAEV